MKVAIAGGSLCGTLIREISVSEEVLDVVNNIFRSPSMTGKYLTHAWYVDGEDKLYHGRVLITSLKTFEFNAVDLNVKFEDVLTDIVYADLVFH